MQAPPTEVTMKAREIIELAERLNTFRPKEAKMPRRRGPPPQKYFDRMHDADVIALLHKRLEEADTLKKLLDDREKAHKKEDKKKEFMTIAEICMVLVASYPIIGAALWIATRK